MKINGKISILWFPFALLLFASYIFVRDFIIHSTNLNKTAFFVVALGIMAFGLLDKVLLKIFIRKEVVVFVRSFLIIVLWIYFFIDYFGWNETLLSGGLFLLIEIVTLIKGLRKKRDN